MTRVCGWESRLNQIMIDSERKSFDWGVTDCCIWACNVALKLTGTDLAADLRGKYTSAVEAASLMESYCGGGVEALAVAVAKKFDVQEIPPAFASRGDIVLVELPGLESGAAHQAEWEENGSTCCLAVVCPDARYAATFVRDGFVNEIPRKFWKRGWRI
jgi:Domain of unknown function (DUF6950)